MLRGDSLGPANAILSSAALHQCSTSPFCAHARTCSAMPARCATVLCLCHARRNLAVPLLIAALPHFADALLYRAALCRTVRCQCLTVPCHADAAIRVTIPMPGLASPCFAFAILCLCPAWCCCTFALPRFAPLYLCPAPRRLTSPLLICTRLCSAFTSRCRVWPCFAVALLRRALPELVITTHA